MRNIKKKRFRSDSVFKHQSYCMAHAAILWLFRLLHNLKKNRLSRKKQQVYSFYILYKKGQ